jgi:hypothetical protein
MRATVSVEEVMAASWPSAAPRASRDGQSHPYDGHAADASDENGPVADIERLLAELDAATTERARRALLWIGVHELSKLTQLHVQRFLWRTLPQVCAGEEPEQHEYAWALADFLDAAGLARYARLCRDRRTHELLSVWARDPDAAGRLADALMTASGVQPPDTVLLTFSKVPVGQEAQVHTDVGRMLEAAVLEGRLDPDSADTHDRAVALTERFLGTASHDYHGVTPRLFVLRWRALRWVLTLDPELQEFWRQALHRIYDEPAVPENVQLSTAPAEALLETALTGPVLTGHGHLPDDLVLELDARFGWSDKLPLGWAGSRRPPGELAVPALLFVDLHLRAQGLTTRSDGRLALTGEGRRCLGDRRALWQALVSPRPRWDGGFDQDALAVMAAVLLRRAVSAPGLSAQVRSLLSHKWRSSTGDDLGPGVEWLRVEWYRLGVGLSWWELSRRAGDYRLSRFGRAAAAELFWAVAARPLDR